MGTRTQLAKLDLTAFESEFPDYVFSITVHDLGVQSDHELTFAPHHRIARDCYYQLNPLRTVNRSLTSAASLTLVHSFITARLAIAYRKLSLYSGLPCSRIACLD